MTSRFALAAAAFVAIGTVGSADTVDLALAGGSASFSTDQPVLGLTPLVQSSGNFDDVGLIRWFAGNYAPVGHYIADGRLLSPASESALFSQIGTTYGGDGRSTFALPNLMGRTAVGTGGMYSLGETIGTDEVALTEGNMAGHSHVTSDGLTSTTAGSGTPFENRMPGLALDFEIVTAGTFPSQTGGGTGAPEDTIAFVTIDSAGDGDASNRDRPNVTSADDRLINVNDNTALFSLVGTIYGGDGRTTFGLPDTQDRLITGAGQGPGVQNRTLGGKRGENSSEMTLASLPSHSHGDPDIGTTSDPAGGGSGISNVQPEQAMNWLISLTGVFPDRGPGGPGGSPGVPFLGEVGLFAGTFAPGGWAFAHGQLLDVSSHQALFSILGTQFGGDGRTTFGLPDLRGRTPIGADGANYQLGRKYGSDSLFLTANNLPSHGHSVERMAPIPLPASALFLIGAIGGMGVASYRRKR